jgi:hypothetical protein
MTDPSSDTPVTTPTEEQKETFAKDPTEDLETELRESIISHGQATIMKLAESLSEKNVARVLRMIETIAEHHREMIASLGLGDDILRRKKKLKSGGLDPLGMYESGAGLGYENGETFGAQAIQQLGSALTGAVGTANEGKAIQQLTSALAEAKNASLESMVPLLEAKLEKALGVEKSPEAVAAPVPDNGASVPAQEATS